MKKTSKTHIAIFSLLAVTVAICGCQSSTSMSQTSSEVTQSLNAETSLNSAEINIKLDITEEEMPELTAHENGGGDELFAFYGIKEAGRLGAFQKEFEDLVKESCTEKEYEEYATTYLMKKIAELFSATIPGLRVNTTETHLSDEDFQLILDEVLCPHFNLIPSPQAKTIAINERMNQLLREQYMILDFLKKS